MSCPNKILISYPNKNKNLRLLIQHVISKLGFAACIMATESTESSTESRLWGWELFFEQLATFIRDLGQHFGICDEAYAHYAVERLEICTVNVTHLKSHLESNAENAEQESRAVITEYSDHMSMLLSVLRSLRREWESYLEAQERISDSFRYRTSTAHRSGRGRPPLQILKDQLEYLRSLSFSWTQIASLLGVSRMTIFRRRQEFGLLDEPTRTLSDAELRLKISELKRTLPTVGEKMIMGQLRALGFHITRSRIRETLRTMDPINTALRWQGTITARRHYSVPGPNSLWHIGK